MKEKTKKIINPKNWMQYTLGEEIFNSVSHGVGTLIAIAATVLVVVFAALNGTVMGVVGGAIYGGTMVVLYTMSTLYHSLTAKKAKKVFQIIDHCSIFLLIAGTYTPYCLCTLWGKGGLGILIAIWSAAAVGIVFNAIFLEKVKRISVVFYVVMGLAIMLRLPTLIENLELGGVVFLSVGGAVYILGVLFYALKKIKYMHSVWHLFVLGGSICHFFSILLYVVQ